MPRLKVAPERERIETDTPAGEWYANLVNVGRTPLVLAVSDGTLVPAPCVPDPLPRGPVARSSMCSAR
jgi:hypothetical protein